MFGIDAYSFLIAHALEVLDLSDNPHLKNVSLVRTLLSFVISMLLVFRTNTAYDQW